ncbi:MAG: hypothetical protein U1E33_09010 [Rhodospirillales bacterium]
MGYEGRALIIDPDISPSPTSGSCRATWAARRLASRRRNGPKGKFGYYASSVMLLDCSNRGTGAARSSVH